MLFETTAPAPASYTRAMDPPVSSRNPEASIVGFRSRTPAISVRRSTIGRTELMGVLKALGGQERQPNKVNPFRSSGHDTLVCGLPRARFGSCQALSLMPRPGNILP